MPSGNSVQDLLTACHAVDALLDRPRLAAAELEHFVQEALSAAALPLPRLHRRLRVPAELLAQLSNVLVDVEPGYERFALPPSLHGIAAVQLENPALCSAVEGVRSAWEAHLRDALDVEAYTTVAGSLSADGWLARIDPGDFPLGSARPSAATGWDPSVQAAMLLSKSFMVSTSIILKF